MLLLRSSINARWSSFSGWATVCASASVDSNFVQGNTASMASVRTGLGSAQPSPSARWSLSPWQLHLLLNPDSSLLEVKFPPIRVSCFVAWYQNQIVKPKDYSLLSIRAQIKMDVFPVTDRKSV